MSTRVQVKFELNPKDQSKFEMENLWAERLEDKRFRILNSPFFVFGISADDIVEARPEDDRYRFEKVVQRGGHSTYRIFLQGGRTISDPEFQNLWESIRAHDCTFENANDHFVAVDVPSHSDISEVYRFLEQGEQKGIWIFEEGHYAGSKSDAHGY